MTLTDIQDQIQAQSSDIINYRLPSYGLFSTGLQTNYFFGVPRNVSFAGLVMDVDRLAIQGVAKDNSRQKRIDFVRTSGNRASAMEHIVPEQTFSTEGSPAQGISAVKALAIATAEGQRIWNIDQNNLNEALAAINLGSDIENEIRNAVMAGKIAITHGQPVNFFGSINAGYLLIDPETGAGAYLISGGQSGGYTTVTDALSALVNILGIGSGSIAALASLSRTLSDMAAVFSKITKSIAGVGLLSSGAGAILSGCGLGAIVGVLIFSVVSIALSLLVGLYLAPVGAFIAGVLIGQFFNFVQSAIINDFCL